MDRASGLRHPRTLRLAGGLACVAVAMSACGGLPDLSQPNAHGVPSSVFPSPSAALAGVAAKNTASLTTAGGAGLGSILVAGDGRTV